MRGNPNPLLVFGNTQVQTSRQEREHLLCYDCEQRLCTDEQWIFKNGPNGDKFPFVSALTKCKPILAGSDFAVYPAALFPEIDASAVAHFAASIFWRASIHDWNGGTEHQVRLGRYEEHFRSYLMDQDGFPLGAALAVRARPHNRATGLCRLPSTLRHESGVHLHSFVMPGFDFNLFVGKELPGYASRMCFVRGQNSPVIVSDRLEKSLIRQAARAF
jgi:hypothetical protein